MSWRRPAASIGVLVALVAAAAMVTITVCLAGTAATATAPVQRVAAATAVVIGDPDIHFVSGHKNKTSDAMALPAPRPVPVALARRLAAVPGVTDVVLDYTTELGLIGRAGPVVANAHGWSSARLAPYELVSGTAPTKGHQLALSSDLAARLDVGVGRTVSLTGRRDAPFTVTAIVRGPSSVFVSDHTAASLAGRPDFVAVLGKPAPAALTAAARGYRVLTGAQRGQAEDVGASGDKENVTGFALGAGIPTTVVSLFVVAGAVGLCVSGRRRVLALRRAVGATPGQIRRSVVRELALLGVLGGALGYPVGRWAASVAVQGLVRNDLLPTGTTRWSAGWVIPIACGAGLIVAVLAGYVSAWRAGRISPVAALHEAAADRLGPSLLRAGLGVVVAAGAVTLAVVTFHSVGDPTDQLNEALGTLMCLITAVALLGPVIVRLAAMALRPILPGASARLATADMRRRPARTASAVIAVALSVGFLGTVYLANTTSLHASATQTAHRLRADSVLHAPGGVDPKLAQRLGGLGAASTSVFLSARGGDQESAVALTPGSIPAVLDLDVVAGSLDSIGPGQIAVSRLADPSAQVGSRKTVFLADGTPYDATVVAVYDHGLGFGDVVLPFSAGHLGTRTLDQILVRGPVDRPVVATYAGVDVDSRADVNSAARRYDEQGAYLNGMITLLMAVLAGIALVNTLITASLDRREELRLLDRAGATRRQVLGFAGWHAAGVAAVGVLAGAVCGGTALIAVTNALTGSWRPYLPMGLCLGGLAVIAGLVLASTVAPTWWVSWRSGLR